MTDAVTLITMIQDKSEYEEVPLTAYLVCVTTESIACDKDLYEIGDLAIITSSILPPTASV